MNSSSNVTTTTATVVSSVRLFTSIVSLSVPIQDIVNTYVLASISVLGSITNIMSLCVLIKCYVKTRGKMYAFLILASLANFTKMSTSIPLCIFRCGTLCSTGYNYYSKIYELYIYLFVGNSAKVYVILVYISSSLDRLISFSPELMRKYERVVSLRLVFIFWFIVSFAVNYPDYILTRNVTEIGRLVAVNGTNNGTQQFQSLFSVTSNSIGQTSSMRLILYVLNVLRRFAILVVLLVINLAVCVKFTRHLKNKRRIAVRSNSKSIVPEASLDLPSSSTRNNAQSTSGFSISKLDNSSSVRKSSTSAKSKLERSENLVNKTIIVVSIACFFGNIVDSFSAIMFFSLPTETYNNFLLISNFLLFTYYALDPVLLFVFNEKYRHAFIRFFRFNKFINLK